jgi:hypothetical protein
MFLKIYYDLYILIYSSIIDLSDLFDDNILIFRLFEYLIDLFIFLVDQTQSRKSLRQIKIRISLLKLITPKTTHIVKHQLNFIRIQENSSQRFP